MRFQTIKLSQLRKAFWEALHYKVKMKLRKYDLKKLIMNFKKELSASEPLLYSTQLPILRVSALLSRILAQCILVRPNYTL